MSRLKPEQQVTEADLIAYERLQPRFDALEEAFGKTSVVGALVLFALIAEWALLYCRKYSDGSLSTPSIVLVLGLSLAAALIAEGGLRRLLWQWISLVRLLCFPALRRVDACREKTKPVQQPWVRHYPQRPAHRPQQTYFRSPTYLKDFSGRRKAYEELVQQERLKRAKFRNASSIYTRGSSLSSQPTTQNQQPNVQTLQNRKP